MAQQSNPIKKMTVKTNINNVDYLTNKILKWTCLLFSKSTWLNNPLDVVDIRKNLVFDLLLRKK